MLLSASFATTSLPAVGDLLQAMSSGPSTNNWDVVASYSLDALNAVLKGNYDSKLAVSEVKIALPETDITTGQAVTVSYDVLLGAPALDFIEGASGQVQLTMPILSGSYFVTPDNAPPGQTSTIPANTYSVQVTLPLVAMSGDLQQSATAGTSLNFDAGAIASGQPQVGNLKLHFKTTKTTDWAILPPPPPNSPSPLGSYFLPVLSQYFQTTINDIGYTLTSVSTANVPGTDRTAQVLIPLSFVFATAGQGPTGVLSIYVQTWNTGNPQGNLVPAFQPGGSQMLPIPAGYGASLIVSQNTFQALLLTRMLQAANFSNVTVSAAAGGGAGAAAHFIRTVSYSAPPPVTLDQFTLDFSASPVTFAFTADTLTIGQVTNAVSAWSMSGAGGNEHVYTEGAAAYIKVIVNRAYKLSDITQMSDASTIITAPLVQGDLNVNVAFDPDQGYHNLDPSGFGSFFETAIAGEIGSLFPPVVFDLTGVNGFFLGKMLVPASVGLRLAGGAPFVPADLLMLATLPNLTQA